jgi:hypothetical protein
VKITEPTHELYSSSNGTHDLRHINKPDTLQPISYIYYVAATE